VNQHQRLHELVQHQWRHGGWLSNLLLPLSGLSWLAAHGKRLQYEWGWKPIWRAPVPLIVVGNILLGGTGKTPVVMAVIRALQARGWCPGVVSRGYGVNVGIEPRIVQGRALAAEVGDEPALIATTTGVPVCVHPRRPLAAQALLRKHPEIDVLISDDGLQHLALGRDVEIAVQDGRGVGNGRLLPAGPLREPASRLTTVDAIVTHLAAGQSQRTLPSPQHVKPIRCTAMHLVPEVCIRLCDGLRLAPQIFRQHMTGKRVAAAAGIGQPSRFFATLKAVGIPLSDTLALPDHYDYRTSPFGALDASAILVTAKDAVKCARLEDARIWSVEVSPVFSDVAFFDWLDEQLRVLPAERCHARS